MTTFICFVIAMVIMYILELFNGGFDMNELLSFIIMIVLLGSHVYLSTRKRAGWGIIIPLLIAASFYPVYRLISPAGTQAVVLAVIYLIALVCCFYIWFKARKDKNK